MMTDTIKQKMSKLALFVKHLDPTNFESSCHYDYVLESFNNDLDHILESTSRYQNEPFSQLEQFSSNLATTYQVFFPFYLTFLYMLQCHQTLRR